MSDIILYPLNWLYNAGVVGFLSCLDREDYLNNLKNSEYKYEIKDNGTISINKDVFLNIKIDENYFENGKVINLKGKNQYYPNFIDVQGNQKEVFKRFVAVFSDSNNTQEHDCRLCGSGLLVQKDNLDNGIDIEQKEKFFSKISTLNMVHNKLLGPSEKFPNSYWNLDSGLEICHLCTFLLIHNHLAFTKLSDGSEIFINAPSFRLMCELNKLVRELFGKTDVDSTKKREILAMSVIEYTRRLQTTLGKWNAMNIEIVIKSFKLDKSQTPPKKTEYVDFYSLPYETIQLISDKNISSILSDIGEFSVLNLILNRNYEVLLSFVYDLIRISIKDKQNKSDKNLIEEYLKRFFNQNNLTLTTQKILKLYANIIDRRKKCQTKIH